MLWSHVGSVIVGLIVASWVAPGDSATKALVAVGVTVALFAAAELLSRINDRRVRDQDA